MIFYVVKARHTYTIDLYLKRLGKALAPRIKCLPYKRLLHRDKAPLGTYIFSDIERLTVDEMDRASSVWKNLSNAGARLLNHPARSMRRFELLRHLYEKGINQFNVYRLTENRLPQRYPVFIRDENEHGVIDSTLLGSQQEYQAQLDRMLSEGSVREGLLAVEFCDVSDAHGIFKKYSAYVVGDKILPSHIIFSKDWMVRLSRSVEVDAEMLAEEDHYVRTNPHEADLKRIFNAARIEYGRIDYGVLDGRLQVWEINTNPTITWGKDFTRILGDPGGVFAGQFKSTLEDLCRTEKSGRVTVGRHLFLKNVYRKLPSRYQQFIQRWADLLGN